MPCGQRAEGRDRNRHRSGRAVGVAAEQRAAVSPGVGAKPARKQLQPFVVDAFGDHQRQQKSGRLGALGGEIGKIDPQRLARHGVGRIVGKEMHAADDGVGLQHDLMAGRHRQHRRIVGQPERAGMPRQRLEMAGDQPVFGG